MGGGSLRCGYPHLVPLGNWLGLQASEAHVRVPFDTSTMMVTPATDIQLLLVSVQKETWSALSSGRDSECFHTPSTARHPRGSEKTL